jgi:predicted restriction endonuclease
MAKEQKKLIRAAFREAVFKRDGHKCRVCGKPDNPFSSFVIDHLDAHHITDRNLMPEGGYVVENGISLCSECHEKAEVFHSTGIPEPGFSVQELYTLVESSIESALLASQKLLRKK